MDFAMTCRLFLMSLLSGGLLVSCQSRKGGSDEAFLADNGGYSDGGFYGDASDPAPAGYPRDGESFATSGGVPFGHHDPVDHADPVAAVPAPRPAARDPYEAAYGESAAYANDAGAEHAVVTPYVERTGTATAAPPAATKTKPGSSRTASTGKSTGKGASGPSGTGRSSKKKTRTVAVSGSAGPGATKAGGQKTGTTVKTVYNPPGKGKTAAKKKATVVRVHDVKRGDSLSKLASRYGVTVAHLRKRNKLTSDTIVLGKRLTID